MSTSRIKHDYPLILAGYELLKEAGIGREEFFDNL